MKSCVTTAFKTQSKIDNKGGTLRKTQTWMTPVAALSPSSSVIDT